MESDIDRFSVPRASAVPWVRRARNTIRVAAAVVRDRNVPFATMERIVERQARRVQAIVRFAYETVPFYRRVMDERGLKPRDFQDADDLAKLPLIDGRMVREDPKDFVSSAAGRMTGIALHSSGSQSSVRRTVYWDEKSVVTGLVYGERDRSVLRAYQRGAETWTGQRISMLRHDATAIGVANYRADRILVPRGALPTHMVAPDQPIERVVERFNEIRPSVVFSYGSYASFFFRVVRELSLDVALPRVWVYGSDMLERSERLAIESDFGCPMHSTYQSVETDRLGFLCEERTGFHLNVDLCAVHLVDEAGCPVEPGVPGEVVISNLRNRAMVLLNYRLGDVGVMSTSPCRCGRTLPMLESLVGRRGAVIRLPDGRDVSDLIFSERCATSLEGVLFWQVVQEAPDRILWRVVPSPRVVISGLERGLIAQTEALTGPDVAARVELLDSFPATSSGKVSRIVPTKTELPQDPSTTPDP